MFKEDAMKPCLRSWLNLWLSAFALAAVLAFSAHAHATTVQQAHSMHSCRFSEFSDQTTCPTTGFCAPPKMLIGANIFTMESIKLQPRTESAAGMPLSFLCPVTRALDGSTSIEAEVAGGGAADTPLTCTLYSVGSSGLMTGSSTGTITGTTYQVLKDLKIAAAADNDSLVIRCQMPVAKPVKLARDAWIETASVTGGSDTPDKATDASLATRWSTGVPMASGQQYEVDLGTTQTVYMLTMDSGGTTDYARSFEIQTFNDGVWTTQLADVGKSSFITAHFPAQTTRYVRIRQTGSASSWWSIHDLNIYARPANVEGSTLTSYRVEEVGSSTNLNERIYPATVCVPKSQKTFAAGLRYFFGGATNRESANMQVECPLADPFGASVGRSASIVIHEARATGGSSCRMTARYAASNGDTLSGTTAATTTQAGVFTMGFSDGTDYQGWGRFGIDCTLTPGSSIRNVSLRRW